MSDALECEVCGATDDLREAWLMTGRDTDGPVRPICGACYVAWYDSGEVTVEGILRYRGLLPYPPDVLSV